MIRNHNLPPYLAKVREEIEGYAKDMGLEFFPTIFQLVDYEEMSSTAAYTGFPNRYPHWQFGMEYNQLKQTRRFGLGTIFEMVINNNPSYAYLLDCNNLIQQKLVMAHVYGHVDFFTNNFMFQYTNRKMMDKTANNAAKIRQYIDRYGVEKVESFMDLVLSLENLIDPTAPFRAKKWKKYKQEGVSKLPVSRPYMETYMNPKKELKKLEDQCEAEKKVKRLRLVDEPKRDILQFLITHAPIEEWQSHIIDIVREEKYYFTPQGQTQILNEGWACYCHAKIMTERALDSSEIIEFAKVHSSVASAGQGRLNPYALGLALLRDIEDRWNKGRHGKEYEECTDMKQKREWNTHENKGLEKLFEVRKHYNDIMFIDEFFTQEFVNDQKLFKFGKYDMEDHYEYIIESKQVDDIKQTLLSQRTNMGSPFIYIVNGNYQNKGEMLLYHQWEGRTLDMEYARRTMINLEKIWTRPINLKTCIGQDENTGELKYETLKCKNGKVLSIESAENEKV
ncbi:MAG: SpoVR family protein [archaeon]